MPKQAEKRKRVNLSVTQKLELCKLVCNPCCSHSPITPEDDVQDANRAELMIISVSD